MSEQRETITIERGSADDVEALRDLWLELHHHHARVGPQSGTFTDDRTSWRVRSASYREWLADPRSFLLLARSAGEAVGYALVRVMESGPDLRDSWQVPEVVAELETLIVSERSRGQGLGTRLLDAVDSTLGNLGIDELTVGLVPGNEGAQRLYERRGFKARWLQLYRETDG
jgi:ribosomal protein S18 acetylase RimI-like enzyme